MTDAVAEAVAQTSDSVASLESVANCGDPSKMIL
jgi:hypothetical protein